MLYCGKCGTENSDGQRFCGNCGTPLQGTQPLTGPPTQPVPLPRRRIGWIIPTLVALIVVVLIAIVSKSAQSQSHVAVPPPSTATHIPAAATHTIAPTPVNSRIASPTALIPTAIPSPAKVPVVAATTPVHLRTPATSPVVPVTTPTRTAKNNPADVIRRYYNAINRTDYTRAYSYIVGTFTHTTSENTFAKDYADTRSVDLLQLSPANYRLTTSQGQTLTCVGFSIMAHHTARTSTEYGGWYKVMRVGNGWGMNIQLSHSIQGSAAIVPTAERCGRGLTVLHVVQGTAQLVQTPTIPTITPTSVAPSTSTPVSASKHGKARPLLNVSGSGDKTSHTFRTAGPFTVSWDMKQDDPTSGANLFAVQVADAHGQDQALVANIANQSHDHNSEVVNQDCSGGCSLDIAATNTRYNIVVSSGTSKETIALLPTPNLIGEPTDANDPIVQDVLTFVPACSSSQVNGDDIGTTVEKLENQNSYVGSNDYPGTFTKAPAQHGATDVTWTLPSHTVYKFQLSQNGQYITYLNDNARLAGC